MKAKFFFLASVLTLAGVAYAESNRFVGGDISMLPDFEKAGATYYTNTGTKINDLISYCYDQGMNAMRVRLFVDPDKFISDNLTSIKSDQNNYYLARANQSYDFILPLCKRIQAAGHKLLLDFHYSDTWADPSNQYTPAAWANLTDDQLYTQIYEYTKEVLTKLKSEGVVPDFIQTGNEISYGMCYMPYGGTTSKKMYVTTNDSKLTRFKNLLENAIKACREVSPSSKIVLHTERPGNTSYTLSYYDWAKNNNIDYDIIGLSYYFYYHGRVSQLDATLTQIENKKYGKDIWIVETGCYINWAMGDADKQYYEPTDAGQNQFMTELLAVLDKHSSVSGLFWWEMDYNAKGANTSGDYYYINNWYNASLFDNNTGKATSAFYTLADWSSGESNVGNSGSGEEEQPATPSDFYLLYNDSGASSWTVPGTKMDSNGSGIFSLSNLNISQNGEDYGWFAITSVKSTDWTEINNNRYGPASNNDDPTAQADNVVVKEANSWQVPSGVYDIKFDTNAMILKIKVAGAEFYPGEEVVEEDPKEDPEEDPKEEPSEDPEEENPEENPSDKPSVEDPKPDDPTQDPTQEPSQDPSDKPSQDPGPNEPSQDPSDKPSQDPDQQEPSQDPSDGPSQDNPTDNPDDNPSDDDNTPLPPEDAGIVGINADEEVIYLNLQGTRVNNPQKGLYIMIVKGNRKKIMIP